MIREIQLKDKVEWEKLYKGYADFYKVEMNDKILQTIWSWLHDKSHDVEGLVYEVEDKIIGLAHYRRMPSPLRGQYIGFLDDLFVSPNSRSDGTAMSLIMEVQATTNLEEWSVLRWIAREDNYRARGLYDKLAHKTDWTLYEMATE